MNKRKMTAYHEAGHAVAPMSPNTTNGLPPRLGLISACAVACQSCFLAVAAPLVGGCGPISPEDSPVEEISAPHSRAGSEQAREPLQWIELIRNTGVWDTPAYSVRIASDGRVEYLGMSGQFGIERLGGSILPDRFNELFEPIRDCVFYQLETEYSMLTASHNSYSLLVVVDNGWCETVTNRWVGITDETMLQEFMPAYSEADFRMHLYVENLANMVSEVLGEVEWDSGGPSGLSFSDRGLVGSGR